MPTFHSEYQYRASPPTHLWFSVETPSVFEECKLPANESDWSKSDRRKFAKLEALAEQHGTHIRRCEYRRG